MTLEKKCVQCGITYPKPIWISKANWKLRKYCSTKCQSEFWVGKPGRKLGHKVGTSWNKGIKTDLIPWNKGKGEYAKKLGFGKWMIGKKLSLETRRKIGEAHKAEKHWNWKGGKAKYGAIHMWINRQLGKPDKCEHCSKKGLKGRAIHWANINHKYRRNLNDWIRLCMKCHIAYDKKKGLK